MSAEKFVQPYLPLIQGIIALFAPFVEVTVHDITTGKISAIYGNITNRAVGDLSPVTELSVPVDEFPDVFDPYYETNWDGRKIKCTTVTVRDEAKRPVALICCNFDVSVFQDMQVNLKTFLEVKENTNNPVELYSGNWQEKIDAHVEKYLSQHKLILGKLSRQQKHDLVDELSKHGVFFLKNAAQYIASKLGISRATIYNYLKVLRAHA
ncbi:MAG: PAS domain-containing protein [bacterium]|nr:PAS domain-containing protein [bacterium]